MGFSREGIPQRGNSETKSTLAKVGFWEGNMKPPSSLLLPLPTHQLLSQGRQLNSCTLQYM